MMENVESGGKTQKNGIYDTGTTGTQPAKFMVSIFVCNIFMSSTT